MNNMQMSNDVTILTLHTIFQVEAHESFTYTAVVLAFDARRVPPSVQNLLGTRWGIHPHSIDETSNMFPSSAHHHSSAPSALLKTCFFLRITELTTSSRTQWGGNWWETWRVPNHPWRNWQIPSGKHTKNYGKSPFLMGKSTINGHFQ